MNLFLVLLGILMFLMNINGYKTIFKSKKQREDEINNSFKVLDENGLGMGAVRFGFIVVALVPLSFYFFSARYFASDYLPLTYGVLQFLLTVISVVQGWIYTYDKKVPTRQRLTVLLHPVNTAYISYFLYLVLTK